MSEQYYIRNKHARLLGNSPFWWSVKGRGYTAYIQNAERFDEDRARRLVEEDPDKWQMYKCSEVDRRLQLVFDDQDERRLPLVPEGPGNPWGELCRYAAVPMETLATVQKLTEDELEVREDVICLHGTYYRLTSPKDEFGFPELVDFEDGWFGHGVLLDGMNGRLYLTCEEFHSVTELPACVRTLEDAKAFVASADKWFKTGERLGRTRKENELKQTARSLLSAIGLGEAA